MNKIIKTLKYSALLGLSSLYLSQSAFAVSQQNNMYFRSMLGMTMLETKHSKDKRTHKDVFLTNDNLSGGFAVGKRYYAIGAEAGYTTMAKKSYLSHKTARKLDYHNQNFYADLNSYHDVIENLELKTALGLGMLHTKTDHRHNVINSRAEIRGRAGVGLQYNFTKDINANYDFMLQGGNKDFRTHLSNNLSVRYNFM